MIELIVLFSASYIGLFALLALVLLVGSELVRRTRADVAGDDLQDADADPAGGEGETTIAV